MRNFCAIIALFMLLGACDKKQSEVLEEYSQFEEVDARGATAAQSPSEKGSGRGPWCNHVGRYTEVFNDSNYRQYYYAERLGISPVYTLRDAFHSTRPIVKVETGENYTVDALTHSMPYLVPEAAALLNDIAIAFGDSLEKRGGDRSNKILVTSLLRTPHSVKKLRRVNRNAVDSSTHMFATTFDISWNNFDHRDSTRAVNPVILKGILAEVLLQKRNEGRCLIKYEQKSPCFHITVCK